MLIITGPTATGKTRLASLIASQIDGEIVSADSRQIFRGMNIGTGKDYEDYIVRGKKIPYHLIDIEEAGEEYNIFRYKNDFTKVYNDIISRNKFPIMCGGSGMYIEAIIGNYYLPEVPENTELREILSTKSMVELTDILKKYRIPHSTTDIIDRSRIYRAIEIEKYQAENQDMIQQHKKTKALIILIEFPREVTRQRITTRLKQRLQNGMIEEVSDLLDKGISPESLIKYGLEYKFITNYLLNRISYNDMFKLLNTAIHQFAKRQMTWFRRMEKKGFELNRINGQLPEDEKVQIILELKKKFKFDK